MRCIFRARDSVRHRFQLFCVVIGLAAAFGIAVDNARASAPSDGDAGGITDTVASSTPDAGEDGAASINDADGGDAVAPASGDPAKEKSVTRTAPALPIVYDLSKLPEPVRRMRQMIEDAAKSGDIEKLRPLLGKGGDQTQLAISGAEGDPITYLKSLSGDDAGREVLAILLDVLDTGFVDMDPGTAEETYVWPYFFTTPLDTLTPPQQVELLRLVTAGDFSDMKSMGGYNFFRVGITPDGGWKFFVAGD